MEERRVDTSSAEERSVTPIKTLKITCAEGSVYVIQRLTDVNAGFLVSQVDLINTE